jgi:hypothetical protein
MAAIDLCAAEPMVPLGDLLQRLDDLEGRLRGARPAPVAGPGGSGQAPPPSPPKANPTPAAGPRSWGAPSAAPPSVAPPPAALSPTAPVAAAAAPIVPAAPMAAPALAGGATEPAVGNISTANSDELWRRILATFEKKSMSLGAMMAHADVVSMTPGMVKLSFAQKRDADRAERDAAEIEAVISSVLGRPTKLGVVAGAPANGTAVRSEVGQEVDAAAADRKVRENEARQHPRIRNAQDVFGAALKEIKT